MRNMTKEKLMEELAALHEQVALAKAAAAREKPVAQVRDAIWRMTSHHEIGHAVAAMKEALGALGISYRTCEVNLLDSRENPQYVVAYGTGSSEDWRITDDHGSQSDTVIRFWRNREVVYRYDLATEDIYGEGELYSIGVRSIIDVPFSHGTLALNSTEPNAFSTQDIETLTMLAGILSEAFLRVEDLHALQERNLKLQQEARIREAEMAVRVRIAEIDEPADLLNVQLEIDNQLTRLGTLHETCTLQVFNADHSDFVSCSVSGGRIGTWGTPDGEPLRDLHWSKRTTSKEDYPWVYEVWQSGQSHYQTCTGDDGVLPPGRSVIDVAFSHGTLAIDRHHPDAFTTHDIDLLERFAAMISDGFRRFGDIVERNQTQRLRKAVFQVSERVLQMESEKDLDKVLETVANSLRDAGVNFTECGINLVDAETETVRLYNAQKRAWEKSRQDQGAHVILKVWSEGSIAYRPDLELQDRYDEASLILREFGHAVRSVVDVPFSLGTLAVSSTVVHAFSSADIRILQAMAETISLGVSRMQDLRLLEERTERLEREIGERKLGNEALQKAHHELEQLSSAIEQTADQVMITDRDGQIEYVNPAFERLTGYAKEEILGKTPRILKSDEHDDAFYQDLWKTILSGKVFHGMLVNKKKSGVLYHTETTITPIKDAAGHLSHFVSTGRDVTQREQSKRRETALSQVRSAIWAMRSVDDIIQLIPALQAALDTMGISYHDCGINLVDTSGPTPVSHQYYAEERMWRTTDRKHEMDVILKLWRAGRPTYRRDLVSDDAYGEQDCIDEGFGASIRSVLDVPFAQGTLAVNSTNPDPFNAADIDFIQELTDVVAGAFHRLADLRLLEERNRALQDEVNERRRLAEAASLALSVQRVRYEITKMKGESDWENVLKVLGRELQKRVEYYICGVCILNVATDQKIQYSIVDGEVEYTEMGSTAVLRHVMETKAPLYRRNLKELGRWQRNFREEVRSALDVPFFGGTLTVNSTSENAFDERDIGILEQYSLVAAEGVRRLGDLTALGAQEEQLRQSQKMEAVGQLTAGLAHNFNNRLMVIMNTFEAARLRGSVSLEDLSAAESSAQRAAEMVSQLMVFSRSEAAPTHGSIDLIPTLSNVVAIGRRTFDPSIVVEDQVPDHIPPVSGAVSQLDQVFLNLLLNARDAVESADQPTSHITVSVGEVSLEETEVPRAAILPGDYLRIDVTDDGIGMEEDTRCRVFEPFFTTKDIGQGTGLGLATVYAIVQQHGGWIECQSQPGVGTTFSVFLPVAADQTAAPQMEVGEAAEGGSETLLFVEDEEEVRQSLVNVLQTYGYHVLVANDGQEGWDVFLGHQQDIDLTLLDLSMPNLSGQELLSRIRTVDPTAKILISSGRADAVTQLRGETVLRKPYRMIEALATIRSMLDQGSPVK